MKKNVFICAILFSGLLACNKESINSEKAGLSASDKESINSDKDSKISFTGITSTNSNGELMSDQDTTDWRFDDDWSAKEENLFSKEYNTSKECTVSIRSFPNPFTQVFTVSLNKINSSSRLEVRLVNEDFQILYQNDSITNLITTIQPTMDISGSNTLRLYYKLIDSQNCEYRGHGDILFVEE